MHRLAAMPGGWDSSTTEGVIFLDQAAAPIVVLTAADTDIQVLAQAVSLWPDIPAVRVANLLQLQQQLSIDHYGETVLGSAQVVILRLLGGRAYWPYGLEVVKDIVAQTGAALYVLPGDDRPDPDLVSHSTVSLRAVHQLWQYFTEGGIQNGVQALRFLAYHHLQAALPPAPPQPVPRMGYFSPPDSLPLMGSSPRVGLLFYRAHYLAGNGAAIAALCHALTAHHLTPVPIYVQSLQDPQVQAELVQLLQPPEQPGIDLLLNTTSFSLAKLGAETLNLKLWQQLDVPVLQVICSGGSLERWQTQKPYRKWMVG
jgi:cobaltochelatase CobN